MDILSEPPPATEMATITATEAKNSLGAVLDRVLVDGELAITKHDETKAVLLSVRRYEELVAAQRDSLSMLTDAFDELVEKMQTKPAREAGRTLFDASPRDLGRAAIAAKRPRRG